MNYALLLTVSLFIPFAGCIVIPFLPSNFKSIVNFILVLLIAILTVVSAWGAISYCTYRNGVNHVLLVTGLSGALLHTLNHSLFKSLLFFSAGSL